MCRFVQVRVVVIMTFVRSFVCAFVFVIVCFHVCTCLFHYRPSIQCSLFFRTVDSGPDPSSAFPLFNARALLTSKLCPGPRRSWPRFVEELLASEDVARSAPGPWSCSSGGARWYFSLVASRLGEQLGCNASSGAANSGVALRQLPKLFSVGRNAEPSWHSPAA